MKEKFIKIYLQITFVLSIISIVLIAVLMCCLFSSCVYDDYNPKTDNNQSDTYLSLSFLASAPTETRARIGKETRAELGEDDSPANPASESSIHSIRVWAFNSDFENDDALPVSYREEILTHSVNAENTPHTISMKIPRKSGGQLLQNLDLYILANAESISGLFEGASSPQTLTRKQLQDLVIQSQFGITSEGKAQASEVPATGLPLSRVITQFSVAAHVAETETAAAAKSIAIPLVRAVSKLHFFFARKANAGTDDVTITKIVLDSQVLPMQSSVFPIGTTEGALDTDGFTGDFGSNIQYTNTQMIMDGIATSKINEVADPASLIRKDDETAKVYMQRLYAATQECNLSYLRESNKPLTGKIFYKLHTSSTEKSATFQIPTANNKPAYRNMELVVYGYFLGGEHTELSLKYYVAEWNDKATTDIKFN